MAVLRIGMFGGRVPKLHPRQLPDMAAQQALNVSLASGAIRPWWKPKLIGTVGVRNPASVFRYTHGDEKKMLAFARPTLAMESALVNDTSGRIYYSDVDGFFMTTKDDIDAVSNHVDIEFDPAQSASTVVITGGLTASFASHATARLAVAAPENRGGLRCFEVVFSGGSTSADCAIGVVGPSPNTQHQIGYDGAVNEVGMFQNTGRIYANNVQVATAAPFTTVGSVVGVTVNEATRQVWFRVDGSDWNGDPAADPAAGVGGITIQGSGPILPAVCTPAVATFTLNPSPAVAGIPPWGEAVGTHQGQRVGVPTPNFPQFNVHTQAGTPTNNVTRVYLATVVSKYGEESAPSKTFTAVGATDGLWQISGLDSLIHDTQDYTNVAHVRLYRTISSTTGTDYRLVDEWALGEQPASYNDIKNDFEISSAFALHTLGWAPPPDGLRGVIPVSGGFNAGFFGRTVCFSVPYYPHAWPEDYQLRVDDDIVAIGYYESTVVILTKGPIAYAVGTSPDAMTLVRNAQVIPCLSAESVVSTTGAVLFASTEGLYMASPNGVDNITKAFLTRDEWSAMLPANLRGAIYENKYIGFYTDALGFSLQFDDPNTAWTDIQLAGVSCVVTDRTANRPLLAVGDTVVEWDGVIGDPMAYVWRTKPMLQSKPCNFGALQLRGAFHLASPTRPTDRIDAPDADGEFGYNTVGVNEEVPINGPLPSDVDNPEYRSVFVRVYGDGEVVWEGEVTNELPYRLPSGQKYHQWEVELVGSVGLTSIALASTIKALEQSP